MPGRNLTSRRDTLGIGLAALSLSRPEVLAALQHARAAAQSAAPKLETLDAEAAAEVEAIAARIIPSDRTPGAREAGVLFFIDRALGTFDRGKLPLYRNGLARLTGRRMEKHPGSGSFRSLPPEEQDALLREIETSEFFEAVRVHTITGFLARPDWGGNRDHAGWRLLGFEDRHSFTPPFGFYDDPAKFPPGK
jgi:gluconate 2-dehydrogenase gamma chain